MAIIRINTKPNPDIWFELDLVQVPLDEVAVFLKCDLATQLDIDWGDGIIEYDIQTNATYLHTYVANSSKIRFRTNIGIEDIVEFNSVSLNIINSISQFSQLTYLKTLVSWSVNMTATSLQIPRFLEFLYLKCPLSGALSELPTTLKHVQIENSLSIISGSLNDLWVGLEHFAITRSYFSGEVDNLPVSLKIFNLSNNNTFNILGNITNLPEGLTYFRYLGGNQITGSINALPSNLDTLYIKGSNTISGTINNLPITLRTLQLSGQNSITGDINNIPISLKNIIINGQNTISGTLSSAINNLNVLNISGLNTISGNIENCYVRFFTVTGNNTISGNIGGISNGNASHNIYLFGINTVNYNTSKDFSNTPFFSLIIINTSNNFIASQIDQLLIDLNNANKKAFVRLYETVNGRTSLSDAAVAGILSRGGDVIVE